MRSRKAVVVALLCAASFLRPLLVPQTPPQEGTVPALPPTPLVNSLIEEAGAADSQEGRKVYADDLARLLVDGEVGSAYIDAFSLRLALAELMARHGKRKWVPEGVVAQAFNDLMKQVTEPSNKPLQTDASVVHRLRLSLDNTSPDLSTVQSHREDCLPSEAVLTMLLLLANNGAAGRLLPDPLASKVGYVTANAPSGPDARALLSRYLATHSRSESMALYEHVAKLFSL
jgi:hypothetical protein